VVMGQVQVEEEEGSDNDKIMLARYLKKIALFQFLFRNYIHLFEPNNKNFLNILISIC